MFLALTLCAFVIYKQRRPGLWETWVWRVTLTGYVLACAGVFLDYWTQWTGNYNVLFQGGWIVTVPGLLLTMVGSTVLGITLLVRGSAPRLPALGYQPAPIGRDPLQRGHPPIDRSIQRRHGAHR